MRNDDCQKIIYRSILSVLCQFSVCLQKLTKTCQFCLRPADKILSARIGTRASGFPVEVARGLLYCEAASRKKTGAHCERTFLTSPFARSPRNATGLFLAITRAAAKRNLPTSRPAGRLRFMPRRFAIRLDKRQAGRRGPRV